MTRITNSKQCKATKLSLFDSAELVKTEHWDTVVKGKSIYLSLNYLKALEKALSDSMEFRYILFYNKELAPIAAAYIQILHIDNKELKYKDIICSFSDKVQQKLTETMGANVLLCGNVFACGETGFAYTKDILPKDAFRLIAGSMKRLIEDTEQNGQISFSLFKEFWPDSVSQADYLKKNNYRSFKFDVNMVMQIRPSWQKMDDYFADMTAKYRTKAKGVLKKSALIKVVDFSAEDIEKHADRIQELYNAVLTNASYKFGALNSQAFINFKQHLQDKFIFKAYMLNEKIISFSTTFLFNDIADANYVGIDYTYNKEYALYQRMLYDFVELAIQIKANKLYLGRTAELIKSSVGAEPVDMQLYVKHRNSFSNKLIKPLINTIKPSEYELRPPFKQVN